MIWGYVNNGSRFPISILVSELQDGLTHILIYDGIIYFVHYDNGNTVFKSFI